MDRFAQHLSWQLAWRLGLAGLLLGALVWACQPPLRPATATVLLLALAATGASLWRLLQRTHQLLARLLQALRHGDHAQTFSAPAHDAGYDELATELEALLGAVRERQQQLRAAQAQSQGLIEQVPTPLLLVDCSTPGQETVQLLNPAARALLPGLPAQLSLPELEPYGPALVAALQSSQATQAVDLEPADEGRQRLRMLQGELRQGARVLRLVALQPVQRDIDQAQQALAGDLVRVLTHEVMNSLTPVTSLAVSAAEQAARLPPGQGHDGLQAATAALARRAQGLMDFVQRYRTLSQPPVLQPVSVPLPGLVQELEHLFRAEWPGVQWAAQIEPPASQVQADAQTLPPVLLNLLRNAAQAALAARGPGLARVQLQLAATPSGRVRFDIDDNGPGIPPALREEVFLPFFTTRPEGSGVGLSFVRQIVLAQGGSVLALDSPLGGARLRVLL
ncbi:MAG: hypothetical protein JNJ71_11000 [Rubrivivax sp.]|nr:hypothetical protein [Rubrivivax sp.]